MPIDWGDPCGTTTSLLIERTSADASTRIGPLLLNPGGPGGTPVGWFARLIRQHLGSEVASRFDVVTWDPRGTGLSDPIDCGEPLEWWQTTDFTPDTAEEIAAFEAHFTANGERCAAEAGALFGFMGTRETVQDMEAIRRALGDEKISYFGWSYGGYLGARYADRYPERVRAFVLDSPVDPGLDAADYVRSVADGYEGALERFLMSCAARPSCSFHNGGDPGPAFDALAAALELEPLAIPEGGELTTQDFEQAVENLLVATNDWGRLEEGLAGAQAGDGTILEDVANLAYEGRWEWGMATSCLDRRLGFDEATTLDAELAEEHLRNGRVPLAGVRACGGWPLAPTSVAAFAVATGAPPILVVGATGDAICPYDQARSVAEHLAAGVLLTREGEGHTSLGRSACVNDLVGAYLVDGTAPAQGTICD